ncbi:MAG: arginine--tRNA ligase [Eubacteriales bacterium]|jgi:arginyl-tRNA synthetase
MTGVIIILLKQIRKDLGKCFERLGYPMEDLSVTFSDRPDLCHYQCNSAFKLAKSLRKKPLDIVQGLAAEFNNTVSYATAEAVAPGFLNFNVNDKGFTQLLKNLHEDKLCGVDKLDSPPRVVIDYGGPNIAKPLHVGHLRSAVIGEAMKRLARFLGCEVTGDIHLGDWGLQMGLVIAGLLDKYDLSGYFEDNKPQNPPFTVDDLNSIYPEASARSKTDEEFYSLAQEITYKLQQQEKGYYDIWEDICAVSIEDIKGDYEKLNVQFDLWYGESTCRDFIDPMIDDLTERGLTYESDGALVMDVDKPDDSKPVPPVMLRKSSGAHLYHSTDLGTILQRMKQQDPDEIWYFTDARQALHFEQVFRAARKAGIVKPDTKLAHYPFGTVNGKDGKPFKTREGGTMQLKDLISLVTDAAEKLLSDGAKKEDTDTARKVGVAALKYGDLMCNRIRNYIFDIDKFLQFDGKTGSYLLYTLVRIRSIFAKLGDEAAIDIDDIDVRSELESNILLKMEMLANSYYQAYEEKLPNYICDALYELANSFNVFYGSCRILGETDPHKRSTWIALCKITGRMLEQTLDILGIETVNAM